MATFSFKVVCIVCSVYLGVSFPERRTAHGCIPYELLKHNAVASSHA